MPRLAWVCLFILFMGIDVRLKDIGLGGSSVNLILIFSLAALTMLFADTVVYSRQPALMVAAAWNFNPFVVVYFSWALIASLIGSVQSALSIFILTNLLPGLVFFGFFSFGVRKQEQLPLLLFVFLVAALPNVVLGFSQYFFGGPFPVKLNLAASVKMDVDGTFLKVLVSGLFNHPNGLSIFLLPVFLASFGMAFSKIHRLFRVNVFAFLLCIVTAGLLYVAHAKGVWAWAVLGSIIILLPRKLLAYRGAWIIHSLVVVAGIVGLILASIYMGGAFSTMITRIQLWESVLHVLGNSWFVSLVGSGQILVWDESARLADTQYSNAHNVFLNQAVYFGIPALVAYAGIFIWSIRNSHLALTISDSPLIHRVAKICLGVLMAMAGEYFFEPAAESSGLIVELFFFAGMAAMAAHLGRVK